MHPVGETGEVFVHLARPHRRQEPHGPAVPPLRGLPGHVKRVHFVAVVVFLTPLVDADRPPLAAVEQVGTVTEHFRGNVRIGVDLVGVEIADLGSPGRNVSLDVSGVHRPAW